MKIILAATSFLLLALAACGGDDDTTTTGDDDDATTAATTSAATASATPNPLQAPTDVCNLIVDARVFMDAGLVNDEAIYDSPHFGCRWEDDQQPEDYLTVDILTGTQEERDAYYDETVGATEVADLGLAAQFSAEKGVQVKTPSYVVTVNGANPDFTGDAQEGLTTVATAVINRLRDE